MNMRQLKFAIHAACLCLAAATAGAAAAAQLQAPGGGQIYALVVGINDYPHVRALKGAAPDARDLDETLLRAGVPGANVTFLLEQAATREAVSGAMNRLVAQAKAGDLVIITFAGHGMQVPERVKGSKPDGLDEAYLLYNFDRSSSGARYSPTRPPDMIIGPEMKHWLGQFDAKDVDVVYVVDSCFGGGMSRSWDPRSGDFTYRKGDVSPDDAAAAAANLVPISVPSDSFRDESTFRHVTFLAAVDKNTPSPEIEIPGVPTKRGALSYAVARYIDGATGKDGAVTRDDLFKYARQTVLQYSQERQLIVTEPTGAGVLRSLVWRNGGGVAPAPGPVQPPPESAVLTRQPIRVAIVNGDQTALAKVQPTFTPFALVKDAAEAELVWDAGKREALVAGSVIAQNIKAEDVPAVVDRVWARNELARLSQRAPQTFEVLPNNNLHHTGETVTVRASAVQNKYAVVFNIAGDGTVQRLFPLSQDRPQIASAEWRLDDVIVREPFGSDTVVAVTADQRLSDLEGEIARLNDRRAAAAVPEIIAKVLGRTPGARLGLAGIYTAP
jgi:Caspase domain